MAAKIKIRVLQPDDLVEILPLFKQFGFLISLDQLQNRFFRLKKQAHHEVFVALCSKDSQPEKWVGWIHAYEAPSLISEPTCEGGGLIVDEDYRHLGIGKALLKAAENWAKERRCFLGLLATRTDRIDAHRFYQSQGYEVLFTAYFMQKKFSQ